MPTTITRRRFLKSTSGAALLGMVNFRLTAAEQAEDVVNQQGLATLAGETHYGRFADIYREQWTWDRVVKGTHYVNCAYQRGCAWNVYVKEGVVWREEQVGSYQQTNPEVPDFNPRGCQKGCNYSDRMYDKSRLTVPLKRVGKRGEGKWKRISWDQALTEIADKTIDTMTAEGQGPGSIFWDLGSGMSNGCHGIGLTRTGSVLDTPILENNTDIGDHYPGAATTMGKIVFNNSMDDLHYADVILIWGGNPNYTHIPNAHFIYEARYKGAYVVTITPDFSPSAIHADEWISVNVGSDAALGLAMAQVMIEEEIYNRGFIIEQTDMPLLVRLDTEEFLRESDMEYFGSDDVFYIYDQAQQRAVEAPKRSLALEDLQPALEGVFHVDTRNGPVQVSPVFERLKLQLKDYTPEKTEKITSVKAATVRNLARRIATAKGCTNITQTNFSKFYHGMEMERAAILVFALAGQFGKRGAGYTAFPQLSIDSAEAFSVIDGSYAPRIGMAMLAAEMAPKMIKMKLQGYSNLMMLYALAREDYVRGNFISSPLFYYQHCGLKERYGSAKRWDPNLKREFSDFLDEAWEKGWQHIPKNPPRILFSTGGNMFRRVRGYDDMMKHMLPKLDLKVTLDWRMSNTALHSDYVLPAAGWYEKDDITWGSAIVPFSHVTTAAVDPVGESKTDWQFHCVFLKKIQQRAKQRGLEHFTDRHGEQRRLDQVYDNFTFQGRYTEDNADALLEEMLSLAGNMNDADWNTLKEKGYVRFTDVGMSPVYTSNSTDIKPDETIVSNRWHTDKKVPWPTLTRRMQFYIDHPFFQELNEVLPVHKDNPPMGGDYPLQMTGGHARWSIHAMWRDNNHMQRLERGEPTVLIGSQDAADREIADGDKVRVYNDLGDFEVMAKLTPGLKPSQVMVYHAWEPYQFKDGKSHQSLIPSPMNPVHLAGGYFHLQPMILMQSPGSTDRGTRVEVERVQS